jgi:hypothetical protein
MAFSFKKFLKGINVAPKSGSTADSQGDIEVDSATTKINFHNGTTASPVVTEGHASQGANRLKSKDLEDSTTAVVDVSDTTKKIKFDAAGTTGTATTLLGSQTVDRTLTLPDATDTLVGKATTDTFTNKTFDAAGTGNSLSNVANANVATNAAIARSKLASGTNYRILANSSAGVMSENAALTANNVIIADANGQLAGEATLAKSRGGTGADNSSVTFPSSGTVQATTPNNHGVLVSGSAAISTVIAPNASTVFPLISGGASADPTWAKLSEAGGGTNQTSYTTGDVLYASATNTLSKLGIGSTNNILSVINGIPAWTGSPLQTVSAAKTNTYVILTTDSVVIVDGTSNVFTTTLPTAVGVTGKTYTIKRIDLTLANVVTIGTTSSQTIDGSTTRTLNTQYEQFTVISDGSNWQIIDHSYPEAWVAYTPTFTGFGTVSTSDFVSRRVGDSVQIQGKFTAGTPTATEARITLGYGGTNANVTSAASPKIGSIRLVGYGTYDAAAVSGPTILVETSVGYVTFGQQTGTTAGITKLNGSSFIGTGGKFTFFCEVPITGWEG